jgi:MtN3 and saliva related transmembrane protein
MTILGLAAGTLTTLSFVPQVIRTLRTRSARDFSKGWLALFGVGVAGWLVYGVLEGDLPITLTNATTLAFVIALVALKSRHPGSPRRRGRRSPSTYRGA